METISFFKDVASFLDIGEDMESTCQSGAIRNNDLNLDAVRMQLLEDNFENPLLPPNLLERSRTQGAASDQVEVNGDINNVFLVNKDDNGCMVGRFENDKVVNLSKRALSDVEISVLSKGLKFVSTPKEVDFSQIKIDLKISAED